jgi:hypothetical protein
LPSKWLDSDRCTRIYQLVDRFVHFVKPSADDPVLLIVDGYYSHTNNLDVVDKAREHSVAIVSFPPHSTHKMYPLDVGFLKPLETYYAQEIETWLGNNPGRVVTPFVVCKLFGPAYRTAAIMEASVNTFIKTGLYPCNRHKFQIKNTQAMEWTNLKMELAMKFQDQEHQKFISTTPVVGNLLAQQTSDPFFI